jgi:hypothetical protein
MVMMMMMMMMIQEMQRDREEAIRDMIIVFEDPHQASENDTLCKLQYLKDLSVALLKCLIII